MSRVLDPRTGPRPFPRRWLAVALVAAAAVVLPLGFLFQRTLKSDPQPVRPTRAVASERETPLPVCTVDDVGTPFRSPDDWARTLLDTRFRLPASYEPLDLVSTRKAGFTTARPVRSLLIEDLKALRAAAESSGNPIDTTWGYRSFRTQQWVFEYWSERKGRHATLRTAARPGHSEHQLGTSLDFKSEGAPNVDQSWRHEPAGRWMRENAWRFGFIESYPLGKEEVTCYDHEPWHYRYFGRELAETIHTSGLTAREYLWKETSRSLP